MKTISTDGYELSFPNAIDVYEFDNEDKKDTHYHGFTEMKAVDVIVEMNTFFLYLELKKYFNPQTGETTQPNTKKLPLDLKYKIRDTFLYQWGHNNVPTKPIYYVCILDGLDSAMMSQLSSTLGKSIPDKDSLPLGWTKAIIQSTMVMDTRTWNNTVSRWGTIVKI